MNDKRFFEIFKVTERRKRRKTNKWKSGSSRRVSNVNIARGKEKRKLYIFNEDGREKYEQCRETDI